MTDETKAFDPGDEHIIHVAELRFVMMPVMDSLLALTGAVMEMSIAGKNSEDRIVSEASSRAFAQVGKSLEAMKNIRSYLDTLDGILPPDGNREDG